MERNIVIKTPGKLMIAGEFAVLEPKQHALVTAVDRFVYATLVDAPANKVSLPDFELYDLHWEWKSHQICFNTTDVRLEFLTNALETVFTYLQEQEISLSPIHLTMTSELADTSGIKYGLGSSAAVVTSAVEAILTKFLATPPVRELIFKLAAIAHVKTQGSGSGADVAASSYGGLLSYASFQAEWLLEKINHASSVSELVERKWRYLSIKPVPIPDFVQFMTAWTGTAASTKELVAHMKEMKVSNPVPYQRFIEESTHAVSKMIKGLEQNDAKALFTGIAENGRALRILGEIADVPLETKLLRELSACAEKAGGAGKLSGAGGGDCGIAFIPQDERATAALQSCWREKGIQPLALQMYERSQNE